VIKFGQALVSLQNFANWHIIANMGDTTDDFKTPGQLLQFLLDGMGWSNRVLAAILETEETGISKLTSDRKSFTPEIAISLEEVFGVKAEKFLSLQRDYDLAKARIVSRPNPQRAKRAQLFSGLPVAEMIKRGWLDVTDIRDVSSIENELVKFFKASSVDDIEVLPHAAKKTGVVGDVTDVQLAWLYRVRQIASELIVGKYSPQSVCACVEKLSSLLLSKEEARKAPKILAEAGIRFVIVEALPSAKIDGVCFWLNDTSPVIGMTLRHDRIDNFWFVLRHELEHVIHRHGLTKAVLDAELEGARAGVGDDVPEDERIANKAAADFCVPSKLMKAFIARKAPFFAEQDIIAFASVAKVHPGLVAGQIRHATGKYNLFASHLVKIRSVITPGAATDGWGDVYPVES
jgi:HTH-type transcriptional regulator / antitoxin HigA